MFTGASQGIVSVFILAIDPPSGVPLYSALAGFGGGFFWGAGLTLMFWGLTREQVSRVAPGVAHVAHLRSHHGGAVPRRVAGTVAMARHFAGRVRGDRYIGAKQRPRYRVQHPPDFPCDLLRRHPDRIGTTAAERGIGRPVRLEPDGVSGARACLPPCSSRTPGPRRSGHCSAT